MGILTKINNEIEICKGTIKEIKTIKDNVWKNNPTRIQDWKTFIHILEGIKEDLT